MLGLGGAERLAEGLVVPVVSIATGAHAHNFNYVHLRACV